MIDTGVLVSAFAFGGVPARAVKKAFAEANLFVSAELLLEYRTVPLELFSEHKINKAQFEILIAGIAAVVSSAVVVIPRKKLKVCRDAEDNMVLECSLAAQVDYLITGDKDLLTIEMPSLPFTRLTPLDFLAV